MADTEVRVCEECGASIYPEHIGAQKAGFWGGKLFCVHCFSQRQTAQVIIGPGELRQPAPMAASAPAAAGPRPPGPPAFQAPVQMALDPTRPNPASAEPAAGLTEGEEISLDNLTRPAIKPFSAGGVSSAADVGAHRYKRHLHHSGKGSIRCRIFHAKLNDGALHFMQDQINDWIDQNPEVEIQHLCTNVGVVEGKSSEPHLIVTLFY